MPGPICRCARGHVFESRVFRFENSTNVSFSDCSETCIYPGCGLQAAIVDATYDFLPDSVRVAIAGTASAEERAAIQGFVAALAARDRAPTPEEVDEEFPDIDPRLREWIKTLILTVDWPRVKRFLREVLPLAFALYLSVGTDAKVDEVGAQVENLDERVQELDRKLEQLQTEWRQSLTEAATTTTTTVRLAAPRPPPTAAPYPAGRANPKGTTPQPAKKKRSSGSRKRH